MTDQRVPVRVVRTRFPALRDDQLRSLSQWGLVKPRRDGGETWYSFADLALLRDVHAALEQGRSFRAVVRGILAARQGQLALFAEQGPAAKPVPARVVQLAERTDVPAAGAGRAPDADRLRAESAFAEATERDAGSAHDQLLAMSLYREALAHDPALVPALINLGNLHYNLGHLPEALALYESALRHDGDAFEAWFNLGNVHHDAGRYAEAVAAYTRALAIAPEYAEACFYLAVAYEKLGESATARPWWLEYQRLAPEGEWATLAREFSE
jgi:Flp pilus assembly protein TadD